MGRLFSCRPSLRGIRYLGPKPQLPSQVVMTNLLWEFDGKVSVGPVAGNTFIHYLIDDVQHIVLQGREARVKELNKLAGGVKMSHGESVPEQTFLSCWITGEFSQHHAIFTISTQIFKQLTWIKTL